MEKTLTLRIDSDLHTEIKVKAANKGQSIKDYIVSLVKEDLKKQK